jgi:hypothetical protein
MLAACALTGLLAGCATYRGLAGFEATDLSNVRLGVSREEIEEDLGTPTEVVTRAEGQEARYDIDLGYIPPAEEDDSKKLLAPVILFLEVMTGGLMTIPIEMIGRACQEGKLVIRYSPEGNVLSATSYTLPVSEYIKNSKGAFHCYYVKAHPRPSTLDPQWERRHSYMDWQQFRDADAAILQGDWDTGYRLLEDFVLSDDETFRLQTYELLQKHPELLDAGLNTFSKEALEESRRTYGAKAIAIEKERLAEFEKVAKPEAYFRARDNFFDVYPEAREPTQERQD